MATLKEVTRIVGVLKMAYPNFGSRLTEDEWAVLPEVWHRLLRDLPFDLLDAAAAHFATTSGSPFPPSVAELREMAYRLANPCQTSAEEAWGVVKLEMRRAGIYNAPGFDDPAIAAAVKIIGWRALCVSENEMADRAHFFRIYQSITDREKSERLMLPEVREIVHRLSVENRLALKAGNGRG